EAVLARRPKSPPPRRHTAIPRQRSAASWDPRTPRRRLRRCAQRIRLRGNARAAPGAALAEMRVVLSRRDGGPGGLRASPPEGGKRRLRLLERSAGCEDGEPDPREQQGDADD